MKIAYVGKPYNPFEDVDVFDGDDLSMIIVGKLVKRHDYFRKEEKNKMRLMV